MAYRIELTEEELDYVAKEKKSTVHYKIRRKLDALLQLNKGVGATAVARGIGVVNNTVTRWIKEYKQKGIGHYSSTHYVGRESVLDPHKEWLTAQVQDHDIKTISQLKDKLEKERGIEVKVKWLQKYCKKNSLSLIKRPG